MELKAILQSDYLDILFDHRNKSYGGYELRKNYSQRASKATFIILSVVLLLVLANKIISKPANAVPVFKSPVVSMTEVIPELPKPKVIPPPPAAAPAPAKPSVVWTPPKIMKDIDVTTKPTTIDDLREKTPSVVNADGDPNGLDPALKTTIHGGTGVVAPTEIKTPIATYVEQMPEFIGDVNSYLSANIRYPDIAKENNIDGRVVIKFVVNEDGGISMAEVVKGIGGGCDEEALRVVKSMPKWKAGKQNGHPVKVYFTLPIVFKLR